MDFIHFTAGKDDSERRLDRVLRNFLSEEHLSSIYKSLRKGLIKVNGKKCDGNFRISQGDDIQIAVFLLKESQEMCPPEAKSQSLSLITVFKNDFILILNKPYDIPVQPSSTSKGKSLAEIVQKEYESMVKQTSLSFKTGPLHRLDRKTTGLIAFSQNLEGAKWFSQAIKSHSIQKSYLAVLEGKLEGMQIWEDYIESESESKNHGESGFRTVKITSEKEGKFASSKAEPLSFGSFEEKPITLARIFIKTGRTHQIRSQSAHHGFPLLGDTAYGGRKIDSKKWGRDFFLHAKELVIPKDNPIQLPETLEAELQKDFSNFIENHFFPRYN